MAIETAEQCPQWIKDLVRDVSEHVNFESVIGQLGFRYLPPRHLKSMTSRWAIGIYPLHYEIAGGKMDGALAISAFSVNLQKLLLLFSEVITMEWKVPRVYTDGLAGPEIWIEGVYRAEHRIQLHIYADPPADEAPDLVADTTSNTLRAK